jgi:hypothetical protein
MWNGLILVSSFSEVVDVEFKQSRMWFFLAAVEFFSRTSLIGQRPIKLAPQGL